MGDEIRGRFNRGAFLEKYFAKRRGLIPPAKWNALMVEIANAINMVTVTSFHNGEFKVSASGTTLSASNGPGGSSAPAFAWKIYDASTGSQARIRVNSGDSFAGSINNEIANIGGVYIDYTKPVSGPYNPPVLNVADGDSIYAMATLVDGEIIEGSRCVTILAGSVPAPDTANPPTFACVKIGSVAVHVSEAGIASVIPSQILTSALWYQTCFGQPLFGGLGNNDNE